MSASWFSISKSTLISILTKLQTVFDTKADSSHTHTKSEITDFAHDHPLSIEVASTATSAINLDPNAIYKLTAGGKTFIFKTPADSDHYAWADITGKPSSYPPSAHTHTVSQITNFPSTMPPSSHTHGNIQNGGTLQTNDATIANGDKLVITDSSDSSKIARASIAFDGSTATKCLTQKGTWENFTNNAGTVTSVKVGSTSYPPSSGVVSLPAYPTTLPASDVYAWAKASSKPSYTLDEVSDGSTRKLANYLPLICQLGIKGCSGGGNYRYFKIATLTITGNYVNGPVAFEISQREFALSLIQVSFTSVSNSDPALSYFVTNNGRGYWIIKTATSTWDLYGIYNEVWGAASLHRIVGYRVNNGVNVSVKMENVSSLPDGATQVVYGGAVGYASSAGAVAWSAVSDKPTSFTPSSHTHGNIQNGGTLQTNDIIIASGDKLVVTDSSDSSKIARTSISFDGSTATKCLTQKGTWESFTNNANDAVKQTATDSTNSDYEVLFSGTADNTTRTEGARKSSRLYFNPYYGTFTIKNNSLNAFSVYTNANQSDTLEHTAQVTIGNSTANGTAGNATGQLSIYGSGAYCSSIVSGTLTANRTFTLPDQSGTIALTSDITDSNVKQMPSNTSTYNHAYELLFSATEDDATRTEGTRKSTKLKFNPYSVTLYMYNTSGKSCFTLESEAYTTSTSATVARLTIGNNTASGNAGNRFGSLRLYSKKSGYVNLEAADNTSKYTATLQAKTGTIALTSDLSSYLPLTGGTMTGTLINSNANAYICSYGNQYFMLRNDANALYFMSSATIGGWDKGYVYFDTSMNLNMCYHSIMNQSDRRSKKDITLVDDDKLMNLYSQLKPSKFKFINNTEDKYNYGFIAQDVEKAMNNSGISVKDKALIRLPEEDRYMGEPRYSLSYTEFIPLNTRMIQLLTKRIEALESKLA